MSRRNLNPGTGRQGVEPAYRTRGTAYSNRGAAYYLKGELDRAIADCTGAIRLDPTSADAYFNRAGAYSRQGDPGRAIADSTEAIRLAPATPLPTCIGRPYIGLWAMRTRPPRTNRSLKNRTRELP